MSLSQDEVQKVALLARLELGAEETGRYARQLGAVLAYVERLSALDLTGVEPLAHAVELAAPERADDVRPSLSRDDALANAPQPVGEGVGVPAIIE